MKRIAIQLVFGALLAFTTCTTRGNIENTSTNVLSEEQAANLDTAYFASGCFWCTEAVFERVKGVYDVVSGYTGGKKPNPNYREVSAGLTEHAEAVRVAYDPDQVDYQTLVEIFFGSHDPTTLNRQGPDVGKQYRSAIFYASDEEKATAAQIKRRLDSERVFSDPIVTEITAFSIFWDAEDYHQNYYELNPYQPYIVSVSKPKVEKFMKQFKDKLKEEYK
ncbi:MAG: peptide-methionine (S)-S-oxide reductase MsrA [Bacteroidota bacterium]